MPLRIVYTVIAALGAIVAVVLAFRVFSGDRVDDPSPVPQAVVGRSSSANPSAGPSPRPTVVLPKVPANKSMVIHPGSGTYVAGYVIDQKSGISYAQYGAPWKKAGMASLAFAQKAGSTRPPLALIGSGPLPGAAPGTLTTSADYRKVAAKAVRWTLRYQPPEGKLTWTASQPLRRGVGWLLGYKFSYRVGGEKHSSQAIVAVVGSGRKKPAMLFATVPDNRGELFRDLNMLYWTVTPI